MAETAMTAPVIYIGENSPEQIAYKLLVTIAANEKKSLHSSAGGHATADRKWLLETMPNVYRRFGTPVASSRLSLIKNGRIFRPIYHAIPPARTAAAKWPRSHV